MKSKYPSTRFIGTLVLGFFGTVSVSTANLLIYEGFDYGPSGADQVADDTSADYNLLHNQPDGVSDGSDATGLDGTWQDSTNIQDSDLFMNSGSLSFGSLQTSGNHVRTDTNNNNDIFSRNVTADLNSGSSLWFTFLADKLANNFDAAEGGVVISSGTHGNAQVFRQGAISGYHGFGIAPTDAGNDWTIYGWDGTGQVSGTDTLTVSVGGGDVHLLGGEIQFGAGAGGADIFNLYDYNTATAGDHTLIESIEVDADETLLNTLNLTRQVNTAYDEIRFGTTEADVIPVPETSTFALLVGVLGLTSLVLHRRA